jgi:hypothetical protein
VRFTVSFSVSNISPVNGKPSSIVPNIGLSKSYVNGFSGNPLFELPSILRGLLALKNAPSIAEITHRAPNNLSASFIAASPSVLEATAGHRNH